jgi:HSP20 family protein
MRYRRLGYRYTVLVSENPNSSLLDSWRQGWSPLSLAQTRWRPATDVYETGAGITVTVDLAGVEEDDFEVLLYDDAVVVVGERRLPSSDGDAVYHVAEIRQGPFRLEVTLPRPVDSGQITARYDKGLLTLVIAKSDSR